MSQDSASRALSLVAALLVATAATACRSKPVDRQALLTAHYLGLTDLERGLLDDAETQFKTVVANAPKDPLGYANLGLTYLRGGRFAEAEAQLKRARRLAPTDPEVGLIVARLYSLTGRAGEARATLEGLPRDAKVLYALARLDSLNPDPLRAVLALAPANLAVRLQLIDLLAIPDSVLHHLEDVRRSGASAPPQAKAHLDRAITLLRSGQVDSARAAIDRFLHSMELTAPYQAALRDVAWTEGPLVGRPVLAFNPQTLITTRGLLRSRGPAAVQFTDVTGESGLTAQGTALALGDYDGDGEDNLFVAPASFYTVHGGFISSVSLQVGVALPASTTAATFADFDNDGWLDLFALGGDGHGYLFRNDGAGQFTNVTATTGVGDAGDARKALFVDLDHDGDLDLVLVSETGTRVYRNNLDGGGTFTLSGGLGRGEDAAFGDFDGDGRTDIFVGDTLYHNAGGQAFRGSAVGRGSDVVAAGDYDNDGSLDLFVLPDPTLWHNNGDGTFTREARTGTSFDRLRGPDSHFAEFVDYDNDGWLDLVIAGTRGVSLFHNDHGGRFSDRTMLLPASVRSGDAVVAANDVDGDGDEDLFVSNGTGVHLVRNDGGNANLGMAVQLTALRTGSGKNNTFGIGSRIEVRAGEIYQTRIATERVTHFGLGPHLKADVLRVEWTNGVPQTVFFPGTDADVLELEQLKGSCAFLYTWDGKQFRFITDVMWQSALGMPLGIMGTGASAPPYAPAGASREYLRIPGDALEPRHGRYVLQVTEELWETAYLDEVKLLAVDHPDSVDVFVDERFPPSGGPGLRPFQAVDLWPPVSATDERGTDLLPALRRHDDEYVTNLTPTRYQGVVEPHDLVMDLGEPAARPGALLFLRGWIYPSDASINVALAQAGIVTRPPSLEVRDARGRWVTAIPNIGFPSGKDKTVIVDLAGRFPTSDHRVRIRTNLQIYWDQAFVAHEAPTSPMHLTTLSPASADLHNRGFSRMYRRGGRYGPHWFAYDDVTKQSPWRTIEGAFTRFGDVLPLVGGSDDRYVIMSPGDETTLEFNAALAPLPPGWRRTFLLYTDGWIKDADLHTAYGDSVAPLPFHAIQSYPYAPGDAYPADSAHVRYLRQYNTRLIKR